MPEKNDCRSVQSLNQSHSGRRLLHKVLKVCAEPEPPASLCVIISCYRSRVSLRVFAENIRAHPEVRINGEQVIDRQQLIRDNKLAEISALDCSH